MSMRIVLRVIASAGVAVVLIQQAVMAIVAYQPRQAWGLVLFVVVIAAVVATVVVLMPDAGRRLLLHPDLLVPLGLLIFAVAMLGWLAMLPILGSFLAATKPVSFIGIGLGLSLSFAVVILLGVAYAAWQTSLIWQVINEDQSDTLAALPVARRWFLRVLGMVVIGWVVQFLGMAAALAFAPVSIVIVAIGIGVWSIVWNLATAALLPTAIQGSSGFGAALVAGFRVSRAGLWRWGHVVIAQLLLLGLLTLYSVSYTETHNEGAVVHTTTKSNTNWRVNGFWIGGYEDSCRWYDNLMGAANSSKLAFIATLFGLVFGILAIVVKLHITARMTEMASANLPDPDQPEREEQNRGELFGQQE